MKRRSSLSDVKGVLLDLDGTVCQKGRLISGAFEAIGAIRKKGVPLRFVTNTTRKSRDAIVTQLRGFGLDVQTNDVFTAPVAAVRWLQKNHSQCVALHVADETISEFSDFSIDDASPQVIVVGDLGPAWTFERLNVAFRQLQSGASFVALQKNRYWRTDGGLTLDAGPFIAALEYASGCEATVVGKPSAQFFETAVASMGLSVADTVMVGDDFNSDVHGSTSLGGGGVLVRTGKFRPSDLDGHEDTPDAVIDSIAELPAIFA